MEYVHRSNGKAADDYACREGQAFIVTNLCVKKYLHKMLNNIQVKACIFGGKLLWATQKAGFFLSSVELNTIRQFLTDITAVLT